MFSGKSQVIPDGFICGKVSKTAPESDVTADKDAILRLFDELMECNEKGLYEVNVDSDAFL